jgi:hypothetical protein
VVQRIVRSGARLCEDRDPQISQITQILKVPIGEICEICGETAFLALELALGSVT